MYTGNTFRPSTQAAASEARSKAQDAMTQVSFLKRDVERLLLIAEALWILLRRSTGYTEEDLNNLIAEIDLQDGRLDGRVAKQEITRCPNCQRPMSTHRNLCIFCGQVVQHDPFVR